MTKHMNKHKTGRTPARQQRLDQVLLKSMYFLFMPIFGQILSTTKEEPVMPRHTSEATKEKEQFVIYNIQTYNLPNCVEKLKSVMVFTGV